MYIHTYICSYLCTYSIIDCGTCGVHMYIQDNISDPVITKIQPYIDNEDFQPAAIAKVKYFLQYQLCIHTICTYMYIWLICELLWNSKPQYYMFGLCVTKSKLLWNLSMYLHTYIHTYIHMYIHVYAVVMWMSLQHFSNHKNLHTNSVNLIVLLWYCRYVCTRLLLCSSQFTYVLEHICFRSWTLLFIHNSGLTVVCEV